MVIARPTSVDVARSAGVSQATVSLVLTGRAAGRVSLATQERVRQAAEVLSYRVNAAARTLRLGRASAIALVVPDIRNPFFASVLRGAERAARKSGYAVMLLDADNRRTWQHQALSALATGAVDGFVLCSDAPPRGSAFANLRSRVVTVDAPGTPSIELDVAGGTRLALEHLLHLGHRRIAHLASAVAKPTFAQRGAVYHAMVGEVAEGLEARAPIDPQAARPVARTLLRRTPTAVFCDDDVLAAGVYKAARDLGLRIPADVSVVGFDDIALARLLEPELTTVAVPADRLGERGVRRLLAVLHGQDQRPEPILPVQLVVRGSTGPLH